LGYRGSRDGAGLGKPVKTRSVVHIRGRFIGDDEAELGVTIRTFEEQRGGIMNKTSTSQLKKVVGHRTNNGRKKALEHAKGARNTIRNKMVEQQPRQIIG